MPGQRLAERVEAVPDDGEGLRVHLREPRLSVRAIDLVLALVLDGRLDLLGLVHRRAHLRACVGVQKLRLDVEPEAGEEARIHQTSMVRPSVASWTPSGIGSSTGLCVRRIGPSAAASASSADRCPRGSPSLSDAREGRLADEEVRSARERRELLGRGGVAGVGEQLVALPDPEAVGLHRVVREAVRLDLEAGRLERRPRRELVEVERGVEHARVPEGGREGVQLGAAAGREPHAARDVLVRRPVGVQPCPWDEVAPVVEVEVGDRRRVDALASVRAEASENARAAVEQKAPPRLGVALHEVPRLRAAGVRPGR